MRRNVLNNLRIPIVERALSGTDVFSDGMNDWMQAVWVCNQYIDEEKPWALAKSDHQQMAAVLANMFVFIRNLAIVIQPIIPASSGKLLDQMRIPADERTFGALKDAGWYDRLRASGVRLSQPVGIFPRLEMPVDEPA